MNNNDKIKFEVLDNIDRRKNSRFYPRNMFIEIIKGAWKEKLEVEDISHEGAHLILDKNNHFLPGEKINLKLSGLDEPFIAEIKSVNEGSIRVQFPENSELRTLLETTFQVTKLFG